MGATEELIIGVIEEGDVEYAFFIIEEATDRPNFDDDLVRVKVFAPRHPEPKWFRFRKDQTVGSAAEHAAKEFGYQAGTPTFENEHHVILDRAETLEAAHVYNCAVLEVVDPGSGM